MTDPVSFDLPNVDLAQLQPIHVEALADPNGPTDRDSEHVESAAELSRRVNQRAI